MTPAPDLIRGRAQRVRKNLRQGLALAWAASPQSLIRYSVLGMISSAMPPIAVYLGALLVNRIAEAKLHSLTWRDMLPVVIGLWLVTGAQRAIGAYMGYGRNLFVRRVQLEAERRLLQQGAKVDLGHFDNSDWHDRLARAKRDVSWRPGDLTWSVLGLSGNVVTIVLMAGLLASLHWVLVFLALASSVISLALERRITEKMYEMFYKETPAERADRSRPAASSSSLAPLPRSPGPWATSRARSSPSISTRRFSRTTSRSSRSSRRCRYRRRRRRSRRRESTPSISTTCRFPIP